jgi:DNA uptake protein ComE-like DNA-binding protein
MSNVCIAARRKWAENDPVRAGLRLAIFTVLTLAVCVSGVANSQDRDRSAVAKTSNAAPSPSERVDINQASLAELERVPGMTPTWAARIVRFRPYRTKQDLMDKGVVSTQVYDRIKDFVIAHREKQ